VIAEVAAELALELLARGEGVRVRVRGASMRPFVLDGDVLLLRAGAPRVGDVVLLRQGDFGLLHRVVARDRAGRLCIAGDALPGLDGWFDPEQIAAVALQIERRGRVSNARNLAAVVVGRLCAPLRYLAARGARRGVQTW
jgi:hypothetical protein